MEHAESLATLIEAETVQRSTADWLEVLTQAGIPCGPIYTVGEMLADAQTQARQMVLEVEQPALGSTTAIGNPVKLSETPWQYRRPAPSLGEQTDEVLGELGYGDTEIAELRRDGVI
jgi:CoA:oxalate CoA-transferase